VKRQTFYSPPNKHYQKAKESPGRPVVIIVSKQILVAHTR